MAYLDDPESPWERMEARKERKKLAKLARHLQQHDFPAAARHSSPASLARPCLAQLLNCCLFAPGLSWPLLHNRTKQLSHATCQGSKVSLLCGMLFCIACRRWSVNIQVLLHAARDM